MAAAQRAAGGWSAGRSGKTGSHPSSVPPARSAGYTSSSITTPGPTPTDFLGFFRGALNEFGGFKDEYRNNVMHSRTMYELADAERVYRRVSDFMTKLASSIDESGRSRLRWGLK
jgi:hypothetical protein